MSNIKLFESKHIRSVWNEAEQKWYFVVSDVIQVLTDTSNPSDYIKKMRKRDGELAKGWGQFVPPLLVETLGGKQKMGCANAKGLLRIIQSIPSPKAEPFKLWLAQVGSDRLDEIENPELATQRTRELYKQKGYSDAWIEKRMRSIAIREELTDNWKERGVKEQKEYAILTAEISKATFGLAPKGYKKVAKQGGDVAGNARKELEQKTGKKVVSKENYLQLSEKAKKEDKMSKFIKTNKSTKGNLIIPNTAY